MKNGRYVHIFFLDGVGLGGDDPAVNPFVTANLPNLAGLLGDGWYLTRKPILTERASLIPTDANLDMPKKPQSATGQATILTGRNVPQLVGEHYGPKPNPAVRAVIAEGTLFQEVMDAGGQAALITPYPRGYFDAIESGKRLLSSVPLAATEAGLDLMTADDLRNGRAVSPGFTGQGWHDHLGYDDIPLLTLAGAGRQIARIAPNYHFSFFEHWPSDRAGHRGSLAEAAAHLEMIDAVLGGLLETWDDQNGLFILTSDHGNIEEKDQRQHTRNPVPTLLIGPGHIELAAHIRGLRDIAKVSRTFLGLPIPSYV
ncbi:metalloenzyme domain-containing protein [Candidatus Leptofilum sp.]|uniref:metalloenzyme domain-containing protein n=1 Tax=Candidatus Leptofilum sp. TaxID=3241576 RepID=UPI003B5B8E3E